MKTRFLFTLLKVTIAIVIIVLLVGGVTRQAQAVPVGLTWLQVGGDGFGDSGNKQLASLAVFDGYLYAGAWHLEGDVSTAQIWRTSNGTGWTKVDDRPVNGVGAMIVYKDALYASSWDGYIWRTDNGTDWTEVVTDGFGTPGQGVARFVTFQDTLYASTWNSTTGTEVWQTTNGTEWENFISGGLGTNPNNNGAIASEIFNGYLYLGVANEGGTGAQLWQIDGITATALVTDGFGDVNNLVISALASFHSRLYASTYNEQGVQVWKSENGSDWEKINFDFNNPLTAGMNSLQVFREKLYLTIQNDTTGMEVWRTADGNHWERVASGGFGDAFNHNPYWDNSVTPFMDKLYVATSNWQTGGEIWQMTPEPYQAFLPCIAKTCPPTFRDDFSKSSSGWPIYQDQYVKFAYVSGEYQILVKTAGRTEGVISDFGLNNYQLEVDVRPLTHLDGSPGLVFDFGAQGYYVFMIKTYPDYGYYQLMRLDPGGWHLIIPSAYSSYVNPNYASNHLKVIRNGNSIELYANGHLLASTIDGTYHGTYLGMVSFAYSTGNYDTRYDNFAVYRYNCNSRLSQESLQNPLASFMTIDQEWPAGLSQP
jgi:hypothetical protein